MIQSSLSPANFFDDIKKGAEKVGSGIKKGVEKGAKDTKKGFEKLGRDIKKVEKKAEGNIKHTLEGYGIISQSRPNPDAPLPSLDHANWMERYKAKIQDTPLNELFIPGTHDTATYALEDEIGKNQDITNQLNAIERTGVPLSEIIKLWANAQYLSVYRQLQAGARYLDLRVIYRDNKKTFYTVHSAFGPSLKKIIKQVKKFLKENPQEIIIISVGGLRYMPQGATNHHQLITLLQKEFFNLLIPSQDASVTIGELWKQKERVIVIYSESKHIPPEAPLWKSEQINRKWVNVVTSSELKKKLDENLKTRTFPDKKFFNLKVSVTPNNDTIKNGLNPLKKHPKSLYEFSKPIKKAFPHWLKEWKKYKPNIITYDFLDYHNAGKIIALNK